MIKSKFNKKRLTEYNIKKYLLEKYPDCGESIISVNRKVINMEGFCQSDYGIPKDSDCTLTSIMTCIYYYLKNQLNDVAIYNTVRKTANKYFFSSSFGTNPIIIKNIYDKSLKAFNINYKTKSGYLKNIGYNLAAIKNSINKNNPVIISMFNDGRDYYKNHSIVIIGYETFKIKEKKVDMLIVYDNWGKSKSYIDYNTISIISCINF